MIKKEFYYSSVLRDVHELGTKRGGYEYAREAIFIRILSLCASGIELMNAKHLSTITGCPVNQCALVWDYCIQSNILSQTQNGYSAAYWLAQSGYSPLRLKSANLPPSAPFCPEQVKHTGEAETPLKEGQIPQAIGIEEEPVDSAIEPPAVPQTERARGDVKTQYRVKEAVRNNVYLDRDELNHLMSVLTEDELTKCLDLLSDWKGKNRITDSNFNDFKQINKWVIDSVRRLKDRNQTNIRQLVSNDEFDDFLEHYIKDKK